MTALDHEAHQRTFPQAMRALAEIKRHRTSAEPVAYEVWFRHVAGHHRNLSADVRARAARGGLTDSDMLELHANYLSSLRVSDRIEEIGATAQAEVNGLLDVVRNALGDLSGMDGQLRDAVGQLSEPVLSQGRLRPLVELVLATTRQVCSTNQALQQRLTDSQASIANLQLALEESRGEAMTDPLTDLFNRRAFDEHLRSRFDRAVQEQLQLSLIMLDIDHFKSFNDTHGHLIGDQVIRLVGSCIKQILGPPDLPARYGGEEFAVISLGRPVANAAQLAEDIRRKIDGYEIVQQGTQTSLGKVTISIGIASLRAADTPTSLIQRADDCLYVAKRTGRNRVAIEDAAPIAA